MLSVMIPARNEFYLNKTINEVLSKAFGEVECIVILDGAPPVEPLPDGITVIEHSKPMGIAQCSWDAAQIANGDLIMKLDAHCLLGEGYDRILADACGPKDLVVPARYQLKADSWSAGYGPIHYLFLTYPYLKEDQFGFGFHGKKWRSRGDEGDYFGPEKAHDSERISEIMAFQGSCWTMSKERFLALGGVDRRYILMQESTDIGMKVWLSGGRCLRVKDAWYAHWHKSAGRGYWMNLKEKRWAESHAADFWMNDRWDHPLKERPFSWFVEHFWPIPTWPEDWSDPKYREALSE